MNDLQYNLMSSNNV
jgi:hypothetical protein